MVLVVELLRSVVQLGISHPVVQAVDVASCAVCLMLFQWRIFRCRCALPEDVRVAPARDSALVLLWLLMAKKVRTDPGVNAVAVLGCVVTIKLRLAALAHKREALAAVVAVASSLVGLLRASELTTAALAVEVMLLVAPLAHAVLVQSDLARLAALVAASLAVTALVAFRAALLVAALLAVKHLLVMRRGRRG